MNSDERQLITGLFDRMRSVGSQGRDRDAEQLIGDQVRSQPYAPYLLTQTVLVQDQALRAANDRIQQLEEQVRNASSGQPQGESGGFLGGLGRMFGGGAAGASVPSTGHAAQQGYGQQPGYGQPQGYPQQQPGGPWANQGQGQGQGYAPQPQAGGGMFGGGAGGGGGFMKGALGAAAGVAGGVLMADGIKNLFSGGHNPYGMASGFGGGEQPGGETVINNYYDSPQDQGGGGAGGYQAGNYGTDGGDTGGGDPGGYSQDV